MGRQHTRNARFRAIAGTALAGLGIVILFGNLDWAVAQLKDTYCGAHGAGLGMLPSIVLAVWQTMQAIGLEQHRLLVCFLQMLPLFWRLIHALAGAV
jgi:hypothetical protein